MPSNLIEYFNKAPRLGVLSTSSSDGRVDSAVFGSPQMIDEKTVLAATANNRTFANLLENPHAIYTIMEPADSITDWKGVHETEGIYYIRGTARNDPDPGCKFRRRGRCEANTCCIDLRSL